MGICAKYEEARWTDSRRAKECVCVLIQILQWEECLQLHSHWKRLGKPKWGTAFAGALPLWPQCEEQQVDRAVSILDLLHTQLCWETTSTFAWPNFATSFSVVSNSAFGTYVAGSFKVERDLNLVARMILQRWAHRLSTHQSIFYRTIRPLQVICWWTPRPSVGDGRIHGSTGMIVAGWEPLRFISGFCKVHVATTLLHCPILGWFATSPAWELNMIVSSHLFLWSLTGTRTDFPSDSCMPHPAGFHFHSRKIV